MENKKRLSQVVNMAFHIDDLTVLHEGLASRSTLLRAAIFSVPKSERKELVADLKHNDELMLTVMNRLTDYFADRDDDEDEEGDEDDDEVI